MLNQRSFSEIFKEINSENQSSTATSDSVEKITAGWESFLEPSHIAFLMGRISPLKVANSRSASAYPAPKRPDHLLNNEQKMAFEALFSVTNQLKPNFNLRELRSAYRAAVLKTHPDQGGTTETFQLTKNSYQILFAFVTNEA